MKSTALRTLFALAAATSTSLTVGACASAYSSYYKQTNNGAARKPVSPESVKVARSREDVTQEWTEIGLFRGKAPTVQEAMDAAKRACGNNGADFYILNTEPFFEDGGYRVHGICAVSQ